MKHIAIIHSDFPTKFGIPRQSGIVKSLQAKIIFEPEYRNIDAVRGLEGYSYIWLIWEFSGNIRDGWSPTVRPPRLGGNARMGVFATRSPFRPNPIGLSSVKLEGIDYDNELGPVLRVSGVDLMDGTPIYDIKPYLPYTDSHPEALGGFSDDTKDYELEVEFPDKLLSIIPEELREGLFGVLSQDPRPAYQNDSERIYGFEFGEYNIKFIVDGERLSVCQVEKKKDI